MSTDAIYQSQIAELEAKLARITRAIGHAFDPEGCACIRDIPGERYTCSAHETLYEVAKKFKEDTRTVGGT